jgi:hypothetical protein
MKAVSHMLRMADATKNLGRTAMPEDQFWQFVEVAKVRPSNPPKEGEATGVQKAASALFGKYITVTPEEVQKEEEEADGLLEQIEEGAEEGDGGGDADAEELLEVEETQDNASEESKTLRRYPFAPRALLGPWQEAGMAKLADFTAKRSAKKSLELREQLQRVEAVEQFNERARAVEGHVDRIEKFLAASPAMGAAATVPSTRQMPPWRAAFQNQTGSS